MKELPVTVRRSIELGGLFLLVAVISIGKLIIMPALLAFFLSLMLLPLFRFFRKLKLPVPLAIFIPILLLTIFTALVIWLLSTQLGYLLNELPRIAVNLNKHLNACSNWINQQFGFAPKQQIDFINKQSAGLLSSAGSILSGAAGSLSGMLLFFAVLPVYIFLTLLYRNILLKFVLMWFKEADYKNVEEVIRQTEQMVKSYLVGLLIQICYLTLLIWLILFLFGIKHALLIGLIFALLNLIPYLGALISNLLGVAITLASSEHLADIVVVIGVISFVQFLDNNILMPRIIGYKVRLNAFASIAGIIIAGAIAGIAGMFMALPVMAALKIVFDQSVPFKKWAVLLGDESPVKEPVQLVRLLSKKTRSRDSRKSQ